MKILVKILFLLFTLLIVCKVKSQNHFVAYEKLDFKLEDKILKAKVDSLLRLTSLQNNNAHTIAIAGDFSKKIWRTHLNNAIYYVNMAIRSSELLENQEETLSTLYFRRGYFNFLKGDKSKALIDYKKVIALNAEKSKIAQSYCEIGRIHLSLGDFYESLRFYKEGIRILEGLKEYKKLINQYLNLVIVYDEIGGKHNLERKLLIFQRIETLQLHQPLNYYQKISLNNNLAFLYTDKSLFDFDKAKKYHFKNLTLYDEYDDSENRCKTYTNLADLYNTRKNDSAKLFISKGIGLCNDATSIAKYKHQLSTFYKNKQEYKIAFDTLELSLQLIRGNNIHKLAHVTSFKKLKKIRDKPYLLDILIDKSRLLSLKAEQENKSQDLLIALQNIKLADQLLSHLQNENREEQSKLYWRSRASKIYALGVSIAKKLGDNETVFYFIEKNKAILLIEGIKENIESNLTPEIKERKRNLREEILKLESDTTKTSEAKLFQYKNKYQRFIDSLKMEFPLYNISKKQTEIHTLKEVQENLTNDVSLISYIWNINNNNESILYGVAVNKTQVHTFKIANAEKVALLISDFRKDISEPFDELADRDKFHEKSNLLYELLFPKGKTRELLSGKKLIIIPDGVLQYIPFEALVTDEDNKKYLLEKYQISYAYSASFLLYNRKLERNYRKDFVGFAPVSFLHNELSTLKKSADELESIYELTGGSQFLNVKASKENFFKEAPESKIIHLATHANGTNNPWIAFNDIKLKAYELYVNAIPTELVVLNGCDTSLGEISEGEGVMSLSRGFFHAGAHTVVSTLWNANDKSTAIIMTNFYKNLKAGMSKVEAIHHAKLNYLKTANLSENAPYYWASIILTGDADIIVYTSFCMHFLWGFGIAILGVVLFFFWKNSR